MSRSTQKSRRFLVGLVVAMFVLVGVGHYLTVPVAGAQIGQRAMQLSDNEVSKTSDYLLTFNLTTPGTLGSIVVQFCSNSALPGDPCTASSGFDDSAAVLASQTGQTGFTISGASTPNEIILTRAPAAATAGHVEYHFTGVTNPNASGSYFVRVQTYATADATGPETDEGGIAYAIVNGPVQLNAEVPPYLIFCTGVTISGLNCANAEGDFIDFGELSSSSARSGSSQMLVATNAGNGYNITVDGTTMTSGVNVIGALTANDVSRPGTDQFGMNLRANSTPAVGINPTGPGTGVPVANYNQPNFYQFNPGDTLVSNPTTDNYREFTASYIVNVPKGQASGIYVSTLTYIALATF
ncbi:MAG TPA: hypothetical protein VN778_01070 [Verrucomicrobiae bacterium]|nr:hypothetical protein [Verrucomicrobiae bacterium]